MVIPPVQVNVQVRYTCRFKGHEHATQDEADACIERSTWLETFDARQQAEIALDRLYATRFAHGTDGHNARLIIATMANLLDQAGETALKLQARIDALQRQVDGAAQP